MSRSDWRQRRQSSQETRQPIQRSGRCRRSRDRDSCRRRHPRRGWGRSWIFRGRSNCVRFCCRERVENRAYSEQGNQKVVDAGILEATFASLGERRARKISDDLAAWLIDRFVAKTVQAQNIPHHRGSSRAAFAWPPTQVPADSRLHSIAVVGKT